MARGSLLELDAALVKMNETPKRLALLGLSVWPSGPCFDSPAENDVAKKREERQRAQMWDQTQP